MDNTTPFNVEQMETSLFLATTWELEKFNLRCSDHPADTGTSKVTALEIGMEANETFKYNADRTETFQFLLITLERVD